MKRSEIKEKIRAKDKEIEELHDQVAASHDVEEVRSLTDKARKLRDEKFELVKQLDDLEERDVIPDNAELRNADAVRAAFGAGNQSFSMSSGAGAANGMKNESSYFLRSNESLVSRLPANERKQLDLGKFVRGAVTGNWNGAAEERAAISTSTAGVIIPPVLSAQVIDKARNVSLFTAAGVPIAPMPTNTLTIARVSDYPEFAFKEELEEAEASDLSLDKVELKSKTAYGYAYVSLEAIRSAENLSEVLYDAFSQSIADMCDRAMLYGQGSDDFAPAGIMNDTDIHTVVASNRYYDDFIKAYGKVRRSNGIPTVVGMNAATEELLALLKDGNGNIIEEPKSFAALQKVVSNQLKEDAEAGSDALVFDPKAMIIGIQNDVSFRMFQDTDYCIKNGAVGFQIYAMLDCVTVQPKHIAKITGIGITDDSDESSDSDDNSET